MKFNLAHVTDLHLNPLDRIPESRMPEFHTQVLDKFIAMVNMMKEAEVENVLVSGDIFHLKNSKLYCPEYINYYTDLFDKSGMKWWIIPGNHDLPKSSLDNLNKSAFKTLCNGTKSIVDLSYGATVFTPENIHFPISVIGMPFIPLKDMVEFLPQLNDYLKEFQGFRVVLIHVDALPGDVKLFWQTMSYDALLDALPEAQLICLGHIHTSFPVYRRVNPITRTQQLVSKPWAFTRVAKDYFNTTDVLEHQHHPSFSLISFEDTGNVTVTYNVIPHVPFDHAFVKESLVKQVESSEKVSSFIQSIKDQHGSIGNAFAVENPDEIMRKADLPKEVRDLILEYLSNDKSDI